jgi:hypothetical protein
MFTRYRIAPSSIHGLGIFSRVSFATGDLIGVLRGKVVSFYQPAGEQLYMVELENGYLVAGEHPAGLWRLNHSCQPNAELEVMSRSVRVLALRTIARGEEITCDYRPSFHEGHLRCRCGSPDCGGAI